MDFFDRQAQARKQTRRLVWLFGLAVVAAVVVNNLVLGSIVAGYTLAPHVVGPAAGPFKIIYTAPYLIGEALAHPAHFLELIVHWQPVCLITLGTMASIAAGSVYKIWRLSEGGSVVAELLGGRRVTAGTEDPDERRLRNVVEEMAIASGLPVPELYVLDCERGINTFAAGHTRDDVAIGVTRGGVKLLARDELQGLIAHEFSHILNGDTRLNMRLIGLAHGLFWPTLLGRVLLYGQDKAPDADACLLARKDKVTVLPTAPLGCLFIVLGGFSLPWVRLIKSAICRQREWLADAAAVQFTRNPDGIAGALKKIGGLPKRGRLDTPHAEVASHLYVANCDFDPWFSLLATHPPLEKRLAAIDPRFDGTFAKVQMLTPSRAEQEEALARTVTAALAAGHGRWTAPDAAAGAISGEHIRQASSIRLALPEPLKGAVRTSAGAANVIFALLLGTDETVQNRQLDILRRQLEPADFGQFQTLLPLVRSLDDKLKLPLAEIAVPALREHDAESHQAFHEVEQQLIDCNLSLGLFEYAITKMVRRQLRCHFNGPALAAPRYGRAAVVLPECTILLSALAHVGNEQEAGARAAFAAGVDYLDLAGANARYLTRGEWDLAGVDAALTKLAEYHEPLRRNVLLACGKTVAADGQVTRREAELLRAIADSLDCPMPPFVEALRDAELAA